MCTYVLIYTHAQIGTYTPCACVCTYTSSHIQAEMGERESKNLLPSEKNELTEKKLDGYIPEIFSQ